MNNGKLLLQGDHMLLLRLLQLNSWLKAWSEQSCDSSTAPFSEKWLWRLSREMAMKRQCD